MAHPSARTAYPLLPQELIQFDTLVTVNTVIAAVCLAVALGVAALLLYRLWAGEQACSPCRNWQRVCQRGTAGLICVHAAGAYLR